MTNKLDIDRLALAFAAAKRAADVATNENSEDGGTCNLDSPAFRVPRVRQETIEQAAKLAGVTVNDFTWLGGQRWYWLGGLLHGQANLRSRMSTAATNALREFAPEGVRVTQYCQID